MKTKILAILIVGLMVRFALALVSGHPYDMAIWANYQRLFYSAGILDFRYFPTLPIIYYMQLASYSFYAFLVDAGLHDPQLFYHTTYMIEGVFLKLPMILADLGVFLLLIRASKPFAAALYFLNPFLIYLSGAWGTYDSIMIFFLVAGFLALEKSKRLIATSLFTVSGLVKLFGLVPLALVLIESIYRRRFKEFFLQLAIFGLFSTIIFSPLVIQGGAQNFFSGFALRFIGLSSAQTRSWNFFAAIQGSSYGGAPPFIWLAYVSIPIAFVLQIRRTNSSFLPVLQLCLIGAVLLNVFSQGEPQWLSWPIPLALMYASATNRQGLQIFSYSFGAIATFLVMTLTQGTGYLLFGLLYTSYLAPLEGFARTLPVYAITTLSLLLLLTTYTLRKPVKFRFEVIALVLIIYCQAYFWFSIVGIQNL